MMIKSISIKMKKQIYRNLFILCAILSQRIRADHDSKDSSGLYIRNKRLVDTTNADRTARIEDIPYIVNIQHHGQQACSGSILLSNIILTTAHCAMRDAPLSLYTILSGSALINGGNPHNVVEVRRHQHFNTESYRNDIALLKIVPPINLEHSVNKKISLHNQPIPIGMNLTTSGWGRTNNFAFEDPIHPTRLRSIHVFTIGVNECRRLHRIQRDLTDQVICTYDRNEERYAAGGDAGNPLVIENPITHTHELVGILSWFTHSRRPDVYMDLLNPNLRSWVSANILRMSTNRHY